MTQEFSVCLTSGIKFTTTGVDLKQLKALLLNNKIFAVKVGGKKSLQKQTIAYVAKSELLDLTGKNIALNLSNEILYLHTENTDEKINAINDAVNNNAWVLLDDSVIFNRGFYQYAEEELEEQTQSID